jgi:hypothetical protein
MPVSSTAFVEQLTVTLMLAFPTVKLDACAELAANSIERARQSVAERGAQSISRVKRRRAVADTTINSELRPLTAEHRKLRVFQAPPLSMAMRQFIDAVSDCSCSHYCIFPGATAITYIALTKTLVP